MAMWYYTSDRKNRVGPVADAQLKELIGRGQVTAADMVWREGLPTWLTVGQVPELAAALPAAARPPAPVPVVAVTPAPAAVQPTPVPVTPVTPAPVVPVTIQPAPQPAPQPVPVAVQPAPVQPLPVAAAPVVPVTPAVQTTADTVKQGLSSGLSAIGGMFKKAAAAVVPAPAAPPVPRPALVLPAFDGVAAADTGDYEPEQFARCREYLREAGIPPDELVYFCNTRNRQAPGGAAGLLGMMGKQAQPSPVVHLALTRREVALAHVGEGGKIIIERVAHEKVSWKFADPEEANKPSGLAAAAGLFKRDQPPAERIELLRLGLPSGEQEIRLTPCQGLQTLRQRAAQVFHERARAHFTEGKCYYADLLLRQVEAGHANAADVEELRKQVGTVAETAAHYQGGHPEVLDAQRGTLRLDALGLEFAPDEAEKGYLRIRYEMVLDVLEPQRGDFPDEMVRSAEAKRAAGRAVGALAGLAGAAMAANDTPGGQLVSGVGKTVAGDLKQSAQLGPRPKNRVTVVLLLDGVKHRVTFDAVAGTKAEMEQQAKAFWSRSAAVRARFARPGPAPTRSAAQAAVAVAAGAAGAALPHLAALKELKEFLDAGALTPEEFAQQKAVVLGKSQPTLPAPAAAPQVKPRVVGCPRCQSKLRANKPGVLQCPRCQAKVRVAEALFQSGPA